MKKAFIFTALFAMLTAPLALAGEGKLLCFDLVSYEEETPTEIKLRLPLSLLKSFTPAVQNALDQVQMEHKQVDLREIWREVRATGPNNYVEINQDHTKVLVATSETHLKIRFSSKKEGDITAEIPLEVGDILFAAEGEADVEALIEALTELSDQGDLLTIEGAQVEGRAWIQ